MDKEFVTYEQALALKELGFEYEKFYNYTSPMTNLAPLKQQVFRWFREQMFLIDFSSHDVDTYEFFIRWKSNKSVLSDIYNTYEKAENACIDKLIELAKQQDNG